MDKKELMGYLKDAYELEKQLYTLNRLKEEYENTYEELELKKKEPLYVEEDFDGTNRGNYRYPVCIPWLSNKDEYSYHGYKDYNDFLHDYRIERIRKNWQTPEYKKLKEEYDAKCEKYGKISNKSSLKFSIIMGFISLVLVFILNMYEYEMRMYASFSEPPLSTLVFDFHRLVINLRSPSGFIPLFFIVVCITFLLSKASLSNKLSRESHAMSETWAPLKSYQEECYEKDAKLKEKWYQDRIHVISTEYREIILDNISQTEKQLEKVYALNFIHSKYRNLVAVGQIYEYLDTGRCNEVEGPNGAYNLFESELRQNIIILKLDTIIQQLEELNRTMYYVASAINESNRISYNISNKLGQISTSLSLIENNTALTAYNTQCTAFNAELMRRYN